MSETGIWTGVDLDGTLAEYHGWIGIDHIGKAITPMIERVQRWIGEGKTVKIFTARASEGPAAIEFIHTWLEKQGLPKLEVTNVKDAGMIELWDDRCVSTGTNTGQIKNHAYSGR
ncbi:MAG: hypothetical protein NT178_07590 [Proteobacteria bacterium]|nr:hypothetical protein [Pseudomonadota bacterium]